jgi:hypothetical protein
VLAAFLAGIYNHSTPIHFDPESLGQPFDFNSDDDDCRKLYYLQIDEI